MSLAIYVRATEWLSGNHLLEVLIWQGATWAPWIGTVAIFSWLASRDRWVPDNPTVAAGHLAASFSVSLLHIYWFRFVSSALSPYSAVGELTLYGVFAWFFVFWFVLNVFVYWGLLIYFMIAWQRLGSDRSRKPVPAWSQLAVSERQGSAKTPDRRPGLFTVRTGDAVELLDPGEIVWAEAQRDYTVLHLENKKYWLRRPIAELEALLPCGQFVRIHRSTIANLAFVERIERVGQESHAAILRDGTRRPVSRRGKAAMDEQLTKLG